MSDLNVERPGPVSPPPGTAAPVGDGDVDERLHDLLLDVHDELRRFRQRPSSVVPLWFAAVGVWLLLLIQILVPVVYVLAD